MVFEAGRHTLTIECEGRCRVRKSDMIDGEVMSFLVCGY